MLLLLFQLLLLLMSLLMLLQLLVMLLLLLFILQLLLTVMLLLLLKAGLDTTSNVNKAAELIKIKQEVSCTVLLPLTK